MPLYKWIGNQILTAFQNRMLRNEPVGVSLRLSPVFHPGARADSVRDATANDFHFDTEIIIQLVLKKFRILELPIPTFYGDEICHVNGLQYALECL